MLNQFFHPLENFNISLPVASREAALFFFKKNLPSFTWNTLRLLENNPTSLPDTRVILNGRSVAGLAIDDLLQVKRFGDAAKAMTAAVEHDALEPLLPCAMKLHGMVAKDEALKWGCLRDGQVFVGDCAYVPPDAGALAELAEAGLAEALAAGDALLRFIHTFAFMAKIQPFYDGNKRTAMLLANGLLLREGIYPLFAPAALEQQMAHAIDDLYERGDLTKLAQVFRASAERFYPAHIDYGPRCGGNACAAGI